MEAGRMTRQELIAEFRHLARDRKIPYAWGDARVLRWMAEGQDKFCEETGYFSDRGVYTIVTVENQRDYVINPRIIEVQEVWDGSRRLGTYTQSQRPIPDLNTVTLTRPKSWQADKKSMTLTLDSNPSDGVVLDLQVWRYAKNALDKAVNSQYVAEPEIPVRFHLAIVEYAVAKAYRDHGQERQDPVKSTEHMQTFYDYCEDGRAAFARISSNAIHVGPNPIYVV
jgi:hypothetical protein